MKVMVLCDTKFYARLTAAILLTTGIAAHGAPEETTHQLPPTLDASNAKIVVISLVGSKALNFHGYRQR